MSCDHNCSSCSSDCGERKEKKSFKVACNSSSKIKKVISVMSGKGGVGKSLTSSLIVSSLRKMGFKTALLDADITGPSIPKMFGIKEKAMGSSLGIVPAMSKAGTEVMSLNLLLEKDTDPVVWRGPIIASTVMQFWTDVLWGDIDFMIVDMPPGTGDVPLTIFQSLPSDGVVIVTSPQDLVNMIVEKSVNMTSLMKIPILGIVENMSYFKCPDCGKEHNIFGKSNIDEIAKKFDIDSVSKIPLDVNIAKMADNGEIELLTTEYINNLAKKISMMI
ncbi:Mrp/NBP35 family ATP-binding protein [bacterium]|nr:Mrp/NBP35 family ATP-binding protein [bacterium]